MSISLSVNSSMETTLIILKVPFYKHPAGTVFELAANTEPADWPEDDRLREKQNFASKRVYLLPDGGRGFAVLQVFLLERNEVCGALKVLGQGRSQTHRQMNGGPRNGESGGTQARQSVHALKHGFILAEPAVHSLTEIKPKLSAGMGVSTRPTGD